MRYTEWYASLSCTVSVHCFRYDSDMQVQSVVAKLVLLAWMFCLNLVTLSIFCSAYAASMAMQGSSAVLSGSNPFDIAVGVGRVSMHQHFRTARQRPEGRGDQGV